MKFLKLLLLLTITGCATQETAEPSRTVEPVVEAPKPQPKEIRCRGTKMIGWTSAEKMTPMDKSSFEAAKNRCPTKYPKSPCLVTFERRAENTYRAICGEPLP